MNQGRIFTLAGCLVAFGNASHAQTARRVSNPAGFSIAIPAGWKEQNQAQNAALSKSVSQRLKSQGNSSMTTMFFGPTDGRFRSNINVVVTPQALPSNPSAADAAGFRMGMQKSLDASGFRAQISKVGIEVFAGRKTLTAEEEMQTTAGPIHQWVVAVPGPTSAFIVTCSASKASFEKLRPIFVKAVNSMRFAQTLPKR